MRVAGVPSVARIAVLALALVLPVVALAKAPVPYQLAPWKDDLFAYPRILDRKVSDKRTFPAIDISRSGTRKEELITDPQTLKKMYVLRRILNPMGTMDAIDFLLDKLRNTKNNAEFFDSMNT